MSVIEVEVDEGLLRRARQYADEHGTTLEVLLAEHVSVLADRAGRRLTVREQTYVDCSPSDAVIETLRAENRQKSR